MKKLIVAAVAVAGAVFVSKKMKEQKAEQELWQEATTTPPASDAGSSGS